MCKFRIGKYSRLQPPLLFEINFTTSIKKEKIRTYAIRNGHEIFNFNLNSIEVSSHLPADSIFEFKHRKEKKCLGAAVHRLVCSSCINCTNISICMRERAAKLWPFLRYKMVHRRCGAPFVSDHISRSVCFNRFFCVKMQLSPHYLTQRFLSSTMHRI